MNKKVVISVSLLLSLGIIVGGVFVYKGHVNKEKQKESAKVQTNINKGITEYDNNIVEDKFYSDKTVSVMAKGKDDLSTLKSQVSAIKKDESMKGIVNTVSPDNIKINNADKNGYSVEIYNSLTNSSLTLHEAVAEDVSDATFVINKSDKDSIDKNMGAILTYLNLNSTDSANAVTQIKKVYNDFLTKFGNVEKYDSKTQFSANAVDLGEYFVGINVSYDYGKDGNALEHIKIKLNKAKVID